MAFSDHAPSCLTLPARICSCLTVQLSDYLAEIERLKKGVFGKAQVYKSLEGGLCAEWLASIANIRNAGLDYTIGAVHFVDYYPKGAWYFAGRNEALPGLEEIFRNDIRACIQRYYNLVQEMVLQPPADSGPPGP